MLKQITVYIKNEQISFEKNLSLNENKSIRVGRVEENDISIADPKVSRHHIQLEINGDGLLVRDLNSRHGTFLNGERVNHSFNLRPLEVIRLGDTDFSYSFTNEVKQVKETQSQYQWYLQKDLSNYNKNLPIEAGDSLDDFYRKMLLFPFFMLFIFFMTFPSTTTFLVALSYSGVALYFSKNILNSPVDKANDPFSLPITRRVFKLHLQIQKKIQSLPTFDRSLLAKMQKEMHQFISEKLPQMEKDIFSLNRTLLSGTLQRLENRKASLEVELQNTNDQAISLQIQHNLSRLNRQIKMQKNIKNILMHLILKLDDYQIQLEILESTLIAQEFKDAYNDFSNRFLDLQEDIDAVYREYNALKLEDPYLLSNDSRSSEEELLPDKKEE